MAADNPRSSWLRVVALVTLLLFALFLALLRGRLW
jgi:hypothetical protein